MPDLPDFSRIEGFDWDRSNIQKNWKRHRVAFYECEEIFLRAPIILPDLKHSTAELRFFALGRTVQERWLTVVFTVRKNRIRVISGRDMSRKERKAYEEAKKSA